MNTDMYAFALDGLWVGMTDLTHACEAFMPIVLMLSNSLICEHQ